MVKLRLDDWPRSLNIAKPDPVRLLLWRGLLVLTVAPSILIAFCAVRNVQAAQATSEVYSRLAWPMSEHEVAMLFGHKGSAVDGRLMRKAAVEISPLAQGMPWKKGHIPAHWPVNWLKWRALDDSGWIIVGFIDTHVVAKAQRSRRKS